ncbi:MAG: glycosyltransferase family 9 protein [Proteobacteria bacterium]|nr:glycosyltransferase family 9 protein [Pseudomonadota bacterium]
MERKLLFITSNRLGDAVLSTGLLHAALQRFSPDRVTVACGPVPAPLFAGVPKLEQIILLDKARGGMHWLDLWRHCVGQKWEAVVDIRNSFVSYLVPARHVFRFIGGNPKKHKAEQLAALLNLSPAPPSKLWITESAQQKAAQLMPPGGRVLALCPTANSYRKCWPGERFVEAARRLTASGMLAGARIAVLAAGNEKEQADPLIQELRKTHEVVDLVGKTDPLEAAACLAY